jgi:hypothetical protein
MSATEVEAGPATEGDGVGGAGRRPRGRVRARARRHVVRRLRVRRRAERRLPSASPPFRGRGRPTSGGLYMWSCGRHEIGHRNTASVVVSAGRTGPDQTGPPHPRLCRQSHGRSGHRHEPVGRRADHVRQRRRFNVLLAGAPDSRRGPGRPRAFRRNPGPTAVATVASGRGRRRVRRDQRRRYRAATWTCSGYPERRTTRYPHCAVPTRDARLRLPGVVGTVGGWTAATHRSHLAVAGSDGTCPHGTFAVPRLRLTVSYHVPPDRRFGIDAFAEQYHHPSNRPRVLRQRAAGAADDRRRLCLNAGRHCGCGVRDQPWGWRRWCGRRNGGNADHTETANLADGRPSRAMRRN